MEKIKKINSLKWRILLYIPIPFVLAFVGAYVIGYGSNYLQNVYRKNFFRQYDEYGDVGEDAGKYTYEVYYNGMGNEKYIVYVDDNGMTRVIDASEREMQQEHIIEIGYNVLSYAQVILIPIWIILCFLAGSYLFYKKELEKALDVLMKSARKITQNELEFEVEHVKKNEIGIVCDAFEKMRESLLTTSKENVKMNEEARRLNAAFSHDIRTPITVMKGYVDLLEKYIPEEKIDKDKQMEILGLMHGQWTGLKITLCP